MLTTSMRFSRRAVLRAGFALAAAPVVAACSTPTPPAPKPTAPAAQPAATAARPAAPLAPSKAVSIEYWHINSESFGAPALREQIAAFNEEHPNVTVNEKFHQNYGALLQALTTAMAARNQPAVAQISHGHINNVPVNLPHTPVEEYAKAEPEFLRAYPEHILRLGQHKGKLHGMPFSLATPMLFVNRDRLGEAGLGGEPLPATWEQVRKAAMQIKEKTGAFGISIVAPPDNYTTQCLVEANGGRILSEDGARVVYDSPEAAEALQLWADLAQTDKTLPLVTIEEAYQSFLSGGSAMLLGGSSRRGDTEAKAKFKLGTARFPSFGSKPLRVPGGGNSLYIFAADADQKVAAWQFIKFSAGARGQTIWTRATGYLPLPTGIADDPRYLKSFFESNELVRPAMEQLGSISPVTSFPGKNGLQAERLLADARDEVLAGRRDARAALADAAAKSNALLSQ